MQGAQVLGDKDDQFPGADDANAALLAWYRHVAASDEITRDESWIVAGLLFGIALAHVVLLGLPAVLVLRRMRRYRIVPIAIAGALMGALPYAIYSFPVSDVAGVDQFSDGVQTIANGVVTTAGWMQWLQEAAVFGALGFVGALAFYGVRRAIAEKANYR